MSQPQEQESFKDVEKGTMTPTSTKPSSITVSAEAAVEPPKPVFPEGGTQAWLTLLGA